MWDGWPRKGFIYVYVIEVYGWWSGGWLCWGNGEDFPRFLQVGVKIRGGGCGGGEKEG